MSANIVGKPDSVEMTDLRASVGSQPEQTIADVTGFSPEVVRKAFQSLQVMLNDPEAYLASLRVKSLPYTTTVPSADGTGS